MKKFAKVLSFLMALCMVIGLAACGTQEAPAATTAAPAEAATEAPTEAAPKPAMLVVSFGTSYNESRDATIGAVEAALQEAYPEYDVRRAFTSQIIIDILAERENLEIDNVTEAMERLVADGVKDVVIQPTHVMTGFEYDDMVKEVSAYADKFDSLTISDPLLVEDRDYDTLVTALTAETAEYNTEDGAVVFMGHGTEHEANATYLRLQKRFLAAGYENYIVGTVEATPSLEDAIQAAKDLGVKKVTLLPLMIVAGDHANNDMAGDEEGCWKYEFQQAGFQVECVLQGMGQYEGVRQMYIDHAGKAIEGQKPVLLTVSFGTSYNSSRDVTIGAVEQALQTAYPEYEVRRAFTSQIIIDILNDRDGHIIENVTEAMERLVADGVKDVVVQPTHVMAGFEYDDMVKEVSAYADKFDSLIISSPLLTQDEDYSALVQVLAEQTGDYAAEDCAVVFMGHGTEHEANATYAKLQEQFKADGYENYIVGTVEATPSLEDVIKAAQDLGVKKVTLLPLMIVAGDHANNDMAGDEEGSWKYEFQQAGFQVECVLEGMGQYEGVQQMIVDHAGTAMAK